MSEATAIRQEKSAATRMRLPGGGSFQYFRGSRPEVKFIIQEIFRKRSYIRHGIEIGDGDLIFDVGANIGLFSLFAASQATDLRVFCFEPVEPIRTLLVENLRAFQGKNGHRFRICDFGLSNKDAAIGIQFYPSAPGNSTFYPEAKRLEVESLAARITVADLWKWDRVAALALLLVYPFRRALLRAVFRRVFAQPQHLQCQVKPLSSVVDQFAIGSIDLLKIDVEGSEFDVLDGIQRYHWPRIRQVVLEGSPGNAGRVDEVRQLLTATGFRRVTVESLGQGRGVEDSPLPWTIYATRSD